MPMFIQCPYCRAINEYDDASTLNNGKANCRWCQAIIHIPPAYSAIYPTTTHNVTEAPAARYTSPETVLHMGPDIPHLHDDYQIPSGSGYPSGWWMIAILALLLVFILQYGYFMRNELAHHVVLRPWLEQLCNVVACEIPMRKDIKRIILINREIRSATDNKKILQVDLTLKNIATFVQPFPKIQLTFSDINGNKIAYRRFVPDEYLSKQIDIAKGMKPQVPVIAGLQILDPGKNAVTFEFKFF